MQDPAEPRIIALCVGRVRPLGRDGTVSAIARRAVDGPVALGEHGLAGDEHADAANHGGPDKAVLYYPFEHHAAWSGLLPGFRSRPGAFGENILGRGLLETDVCLGDVLAVGRATLEVSQPRQPCFKLDLHLGFDAAARTALATGRTGFYLRVRAGGVVAAGDRIRLLSRPHPDWPLTRVRGAYLGRGGDEAEAERLSRLPALSEAWRARLRARGSRPSRPR